MNKDIFLRDDNILELNLPKQNKFYSIPLFSSDYIYIIKDEKYITMILNDQQQVNMIPIEMYNDLYHFISKSFNYKFKDYKMKTVIMKKDAINKDRNELTQDDFIDSEDTVDLFINSKSKNILSITTEGEDENKVYVSIKNKGVMVINKIGGQ